LGKLLDHLATGFQVGRLGRAPGTLGTLWGIPVAWLLSRAGPLSYVAGSISITFGAIFVAEWYESQNPGHDHPEVVIDEVAGFVTTMALIPFTWVTALAAFVLFRFFDILKPYPISYIDRKIEGGLGVVSDDIAAGVAANVLLQFICFKTTLLGVF
jgi:phosphatidylglycerophosphatase A